MRPSPSCPRSHLSPENGDDFPDDQPFDRDDVIGFQRSFQARLSGDQEAPPVDTETRGAIRLRFNPALPEVGFALVVREGIGVTQAHLHCGKAGTNGPVVAFLFGLVAPGEDVDGLLAEETLTNADIMAQDPPEEVCGVTINNIASLLEAIRQGQIYANVHTEANPPGEVRGQIFGGTHLNIPQLFRDND